MVPGKAHKPKLGLGKLSKKGSRRSPSETESGPLEGAVPLQATLHEQVVITKKKEEPNGGSDLVEPAVKHRVPSYLPWCYILPTVNNS